VITLVQALNYRCLRYISQPLDSFHILVGPNASGKSTFLDVIAFLGKLVSDGLEAAIDERTSNIQDLIWGRKGRSFELAIAARIPALKRKELSDPNYNFIRYEVEIGLDDSDEISILGERVLLLHKIKIKNPYQRYLFPEKIPPPESIKVKLEKSKLILNKTHGGKDYFQNETGKKWLTAFQFGPRTSIFSGLPPDESLFPATVWLKKLLTEGIHYLVLNSQLIKKASPPSKRKGFIIDGSNLPWVIYNLKKNNEKAFKDWIAHLQTAIPEIKNIKTIENPDDKSRYLVLSYNDGLDVPSWMCSDGTLRLMALTILAYIPDLEGIFLIEEPENGIHPKAIETMYQSLSSVYDGQILTATHSPIILRITEADKLLCFAKNDEGATDIVLGSEHPRLKDWQQEVDLGDLFVGGVLG